MGMLVYSPLAQGVLTNKYAGGATPAGSRATTAFAHFLESETALTPENVADGERLGAWCAAARAGTGAGGARVGAAGRRRSRARSSAPPAMAQLEQNLQALDLTLSDAQWREVEGCFA